VITILTVYPFPLYFFARRNLLEMENNYDLNEYRDQSEESEKDINKALDRIIEKAKTENEALKEMLNKIFSKKPGNS
jgi:hypothetical protein